MATYVLIRHGSNGANQPMTPNMVVGIVEAESADKAKDLAHEKYGRYNNQHFEARLASRCGKTILVEAQEAELLFEEEDRHWSGVAGKST